MGDGGWEHVQFSPLGMMFSLCCFAPRLILPQGTEDADNIREDPRSLLDLGKLVDLKARREGIVQSHATRECA